MSTSPSILFPKPIAPEVFTDAVAAVERIEEIYERNTKFLRDLFEAYVKGEPFEARVRAAYPFVRITTTTYARLDSRLSYGFVAGPGAHETTVTRPDLFRAYLTEQIGLLIENHGVAVEIGESDEPIPIHFAYRRDINIEASVSMRNQTPSDRPLRDVFDTPDLAMMDDAIVNGTLKVRPGAPAPLALFRAARIDYSLHRLYHYTCTDPEHFQNFVIFTYTSPTPMPSRGSATSAWRKAIPVTRPSSSLETSSRAMRAMAAPVRLAPRRSTRLRCRPFISSRQTAAALL